MIDDHPCVCGHARADHNYDDTDGYYTSCLIGWVYSEGGDVLPYPKSYACRCESFKRDVAP